MELPKSSGEFKAYMDKSKITRKSSAQYKLKQLYWTDKDGFCRFNQFYVVAMGTFYAKNIGDILRITIDKRVIYVIIGEVKRDKDTVDRKYCVGNGSIVEFIIDGEKMKQEYLLKGNLEDLNLKGKVVKIEKLISINY